MLLQTNKNAYKKKEIKMIMLMNLKVLACHDQGMHDIYHCLIEKKGTPSYICYMNCGLYYVYYCNVVCFNSFNAYDL